MEGFLFACVKGRGDGGAGAAVPGGDPPDCVGRGEEPVVAQMGVAGGDGLVAVAEQLGDFVERDSVVDAEAGEGVPEVLKPGLGRQGRRGLGPLPDPGDALDRPARPARRGEHERLPRLPRL
jgi:hypothetical protein